MSRQQSERERRSRERSASVGEAYRTAHELLSASLTAGLLIYGGYWLDKRWGYLPLLTACGGVLGAISAVAAVRQVLRRLELQSARERAARSRNTPVNTGNPASPVDSPQRTTFDTEGP